MEITVIADIGGRKEAELYIPEVLGPISKLRSWRLLAKACSI